MSGHMWDELQRERARSDRLRRELAEPIPVILFCPACGLQHIDSPDERTPDWTNPPHRSHLCHGCGHIWRPCDRATVGVAAIETQGKADSPAVNPQTKLAERDAALAVVIGVLERFSRGIPRIDPTPTRFMPTNNKEAMQVEDFWSRYFGDAIEIVRHDAKEALANLPASARAVMEVVEIARERHEDCQQRIGHEKRPDRVGPCAMCDALAKLNGKAAL